MTSLLSGKSYRVALRGMERGPSYCSCPDFRTNTLGTCKHILHVQGKVKRKFDAADLKKPYRRKRIAVHLHYDHEVTLRLAAPERLKDEVADVVKPLLEQADRERAGLLKRLNKLEQLGQEFHVYPDAEELIQQRLVRERMQERMAEIRQSPAKHPLRTVAARRCRCCRISSTASPSPHRPGRAVLADDMGLGKTIQGVGVAEMLAREAGIRKVLDRLPGLAQIAVEERNPPLLRSRRAARRRRQRLPPPAIRPRLLLHGLQLRAGAPRHPRYRAGEVGPDRPRRRAADQKLGVEDGPRDQGPPLAVRPRAVGHAAGKPPGRPVLRRAVHRPAAAGAGLPLLQPAPHRR